MLSIKNLEGIFRDLADKYISIDSFGYGFEFDIQSKKQSERGMVGMWVQPITTQMILSRSNTGVVRRYRVYVWDLIRRDEKNSIEVWNDCELILLDFIRLFSFKSKDLGVDNQPILVPFKEKYEDDVSGYYVDLDIKSWDISGDCDIPLKE
jgi:hypothetical protein